MTVVIPSFFDGIIAMPLFLPPLVVAVSVVLLPPAAALRMGLFWSGGRVVVPIALSSLMEVLGLELDLRGRVPPLLLRIRWWC